MGSFLGGKRVDTSLASAGAVSLKLNQCFICGFFVCLS